MNGVTLQYKFIKNFPVGAAQYGDINTPEGVLWKLYQVGLYLNQDNTTTGTRQVVMWVGTGHATDSNKGPLLYFENANGTAGTGTTAFVLGTSYLVQPLSPISSSIGAVNQGSGSLPVSLNRPLYVFPSENLGYYVNTYGTDVLTLSYVYKEIPLDVWLAEND